MNCSLSAVARSGLHFNSNPRAKVLEVHIGNLDIKTEVAYGVHSNKLNDLNYNLYKPVSSDSRDMVFPRELIVK